MSEGFKGFAWVLFALGAFLILFGVFNSNSNLLVFGMASAVCSIPLFISSGFCKIMEDTRDTLRRIETLLQNENNQE